MKIIVADPRRTDTAEMADLFLPLQPGTDVMLFNGLLHIMLWEGWTDAPTSPPTPAASTR
jgi:assimilatory nitrate reductase catalytic subunit